MKTAEEFLIWTRRWEKVSSMKKRYIWNRPLKHSVCVPCQKRRVAHTCTPGPKCTWLHLTELDVIAAPQRRVSRILQESEIMFMLNWRRLIKFLLLLYAQSPAGHLWPLGGGGGLSWTLRTYISGRNETHPGTQIFSGMNISSEVKESVSSWNHSERRLSDGCWGHEEQNTTQAAAGFVLDWKRTLDKQRAGPTMGHHRVENTQTKQQESGPTPKERLPFGDADNRGEALTFW